MSRKHLIVIVGPTAVGKSQLAIDLALHYGAEIISADSRQFYKEMSIATAKPGKEDLQKVTHHFVGFISVAKNYSAGEFATAVDERLKSIFAEQDVCIMAGGSGLFVHAVCEGLDNIPTVDAGIRTQLNRQYEESGIEGLSRQLKELDPDHYEVTDLQNHRRIIRALEVCLSTGAPYSTFLHKSSKHTDYKVVKIGLDMGRELLYKRIEERVDAMIEAGLEEEVRSLKQFQHCNALNAVGYREMFEYLDGNISLEESVGLIKRNTRRYAKRQLTWFKRDVEITWFDPQQKAAVLIYVDSIITGVS